MKKYAICIIALLIQYLFCFSQSININSITTARQTGGASGYTLDGSWMVSSSREKLLNTNNFGPSGTYSKSINIIDGYAASGSLTVISSVPTNEIFFFGSFDINDPSTQQFTTSEINALYNWSMSGGKLIIAESPIYSSWYNPSVLNSKWGFDLTLSAPSSIIPTAEGNSTDIFNGPFGNVFSANQGAADQGYFNVVPPNSVILATDATGNPTLILDCNTMDLIVADVDAFTSLSGITSGSTINNMQDIFWANVIVFMDRLYDDYLSIGCDKVLPLPIFIPNAFTPNGDNINDIFKCEGSGVDEFTMSIFNRWGNLVYETNDFTKGWDGKSHGKEQPLGVYVYYMTGSFYDGKKFEKKGIFVLIR